MTQRKSRSNATSSFSFKTPLTLEVEGVFLVERSSRSVESVYNVAVKRLRDSESGNSFYRDERGHFVSKKQIEQYYSDVPFREALYQQRIQSSHVEHLLREDYPILHRAPEYDRERDERLREFAETPREDRTREQWRQWEEDMTAIYGDDKDDWGDYA